MAAAEQFYDEYKQLLSEGMLRLQTRLKAEHPDFEDPCSLSDQILSGSLGFSNKIEAVLTGKGCL